MNKKKTHIDGVSHRPRRRSIGDFDATTPLHTRADSLKSGESQRENKQINQSQMPTKPQLDKAIETDPIEGTRSPVDIPKKHFSRFKARRKAKRMAKKQKLQKLHPFWRNARRFGSVAVLSLALLGAVIGIQTWWALQNVIDRAGDGAVALQDNIQPSQLSGEGDGRVNIMMLGIGGDQHEAGNLADSIIVASIDPFAKEVALLSIPRDMYVDVPGYWSMKINAAHATGIDQDHPGGGIALMEETLEQVLDIPIHYYVRVDFQGWISAVDAVGGITVNLPNAVYDNNFDWQYGRDALRLPAGENQLNGTTSLLLARARGVGYGSYGLERSDFTRAEHQRLMLVALKDKVLSLDTLANPSKISSLISTAGTHMRTNLQISEILRIYELMESVSDDKILTYGIDNANYLTNMTGTSNLVPRSGDYTEIQKFVRSIFVDGFIRSESAQIDVLNGSGVTGLASETAAELESYGYQIYNIGDAPRSDFQETALYDLSNGESPFTKRLLEQRFGVSALPKNQLPGSIVTTSQFVIIVGQNATQN